MQTQLEVTLSGDLSGNKLDEFRRRLGLQKRGRPSDDQDQEFGYRDLRAAGGSRRWLDLWRDSDTEWSVRIVYEVDPVPAEEFSRLRRQILAVADEFELRVTGEYAAEDVAAARMRLAAWMTEQSPVTGRQFTAEDLEGYAVSTKGEWYVFTPTGRANRVYLVSGETVYSFAPSRETLESALENARAEAG